MSMTREGYEKVLYIQFLIDFREALSNKSGWSQAVEERANVNESERSKVKVSLEAIADQFDENGNKKKDATFFIDERVLLAVSVCGMNTRASDREKIVIPAIAFVVSSNLSGKFFYLQAQGESFLFRTTKKWFGFSNNYFSDFSPWFSKLKEDFSTEHIDYIDKNGNLNTVVLNKLNEMVQKEIKTLSLEETNFHDKLKNVSLLTAEQYQEVLLENSSYNESNVSQKADIEYSLQSYIHVSSADAKEETKTDEEKHNETENIELKKNEVEPSRVPEDDEEKAENNSSIGSQENNENKVKTSEEKSDVYSISEDRDENKQPALWVKLFNWIMSFFKKESSVNTDPPPVIIKEKSNDAPEKAKGCWGWLKYSLLCKAKPKLNSDEGQVQHSDVEDKKNSPGGS